MDIDSLLRSEFPTSNKVEISAGARGSKVFRLREEGGKTTLVKVYTSPGRERRERHALEALASLSGIPNILSRGLSEGVAWIQMNDPGNWNLGALPANLTIIRSAGRVLRGVHESKVQITNMANLIDNDEIEVHYQTTLSRLDKFRRRLSLPAEVLQRATEAGPPLASPPRPAHTRPTPNLFFLSEDEQVSLVDWEWATMAPPEWDVSLASWQFAHLFGPDAGEAFLEGYGAVVTNSRLKSWIAYHSAMMMLEAAESRDGNLRGMAPMVRSLADAVGFS